MKKLKNSKDSEIWKDIEGFEGQYAISTKGRVRNKKTNRIFTGSCNRDGYVTVKLNGESYYIHRLMALAFIPNPQNLPFINHKNEIKHDNYISNIEWCSASYNVNYSTYKRSCKIKQIDKNGNLIKTWESSKQIERETGYDQSHIIKCCKGKYKQAYNFRWEYLDASQQYKFNRPVVVYKKTEFIGVFANARKASEALGLKYSSVYYCLKGRLNSNKGYTFIYID